MKNKNIIIYIIFAIILFIISYFLFNKYNYNNEIAKQELQLKCKEIYNESHQKLEYSRYGLDNYSADAIIWSSKTKSCLAYYRVPQNVEYKFLFEVWDYTNTDLVLSYNSELSDSCIVSGVVTQMDQLIYKYNPKLEGRGCSVSNLNNNVDLLTNFEVAMIELGFKK